jgi:hypothetical protein
MAANPAEISGELAPKLSLTMSHVSWVMNMIMVVVLLQSNGVAATLKMSRLLTNLVFEAISKVSDAC